MPVNQGPDQLNGSLRSELLAMSAEDQAAMSAFLADASSHRRRFDATQPIESGTPWPYVLLEWEPLGEAPASARRVVSMVRAHTARLREIVAGHGWPGRSLVGEDGADAAWLVLQHTNSRVTTIRSPAGDEFCRSCVVLLREAVARGEAHPRHLAAIADSLRLATDQPPEFASLPGQYDLDDQGEAVFAWPVDRAALDQRRVAIGLPPLAADLARLRAGAPADEIGPELWEPWAPRRAGSAAGGAGLSPDPGSAARMNGVSGEDRARSIDADVPNIARVYDFFLGGKDNFAADRELAARIAELSPDWVQACRDNRQFVGRAVTWAAGQGIRQFLDLGAGLPTRPAVHETAREIIPDARVCYVDNDPVVAAHARALLIEPDGVGVAEADLADPAAVLAHPVVSSIIDPAEPVCVVLAMVVHFYDPAVARELTREYAARLAPGSALAISCGRNDDPDMWQRMRQSYTAATTYNHTRDELRSFFGAMPLVPPGLALARSWRGGMAEVPEQLPGPAYVLAAVGVKP